MAEDSKIINLETVSNPDMLAGVLRALNTTLQAMIVSVNELVVDHSTFVTSHDGLIADVSQMIECHLSAGVVIEGGTWVSNVSAGYDASTFTSNLDVGPAQLTASEVIPTGNIDTGLDTAANPESLRLLLEKMNTRMSMINKTTVELGIDHEEFRSSHLSMQVATSALGSAHLSGVTQLEAGTPISDFSGATASSFDSDAYGQAPPATLGSESVVTAMVGQGN